MYNILICLSCIIVNQVNFAERIYFHVFMILTSCYLNMLLTNWGALGADYSSLGLDTQTMWIKLSSQGINILLYLRMLYVAYIDNLA